MRKNKGKNKKQSGKNLKVSPLKRYKKQIKRMKHRLQDGILEKKDIYKTRLDGAEEHLRNYDKEQEQKKADALKAAALAKKAG